MSVLQAHEANGVATLTLNRPEVRNALNAELFAALRDELREQAAKKATRVVVLTGAAPAFCAGGDIRAMLEREGKAEETTRYVNEVVSGVVGALWSMEKPVIAKVNGDAFGAGLSLAAACDLVYAAKEARFSAPFARLGLIPDTGSSWTLQRRVGLGRAKELLFLMDVIDADRALGLGLVNAVVPRAHLDAFVDERAQRMAAGPTQTYGLQKRALHQAATSPFDDALRFEADLQGFCFTTAEHKEGVAAFLDKREPRFRGAT